MSELKKKPSLLYVLQILQKYSHEKNPLTQNKIAEYLLDEYDIELERKAIGRCIDTLEAAGYDIVRDAKGVYLGTASALEDAQLQIIIDSVISNRAITATDSKKLVDQLLSMGTAGLKLRNPHINSLNTWGKPEKSATRYNIDAVQKAILEKHQISFFYDEHLFHLHHSTWGL
jgi:biotin operon repressor